MSSVIFQKSITISYTFQHKSIRFIMIEITHFNEEQSELLSAIKEKAILLNISNEKMKEIDKIMDGKSLDYHTLQSIIDILTSAVNALDNKSFSIL